MFAVQIDFVLAGDAFWRPASRVRRIRRVDPHFANGNPVALAVGPAPISKDIDVGALSLSEIAAIHRAGWKIHSGKQNEFSPRRCGMNLGQEDSDTIAIHLKVAGSCCYGRWCKRSWEEEQDRDEAEKDARSY